MALRRAPGPGIKDKPVWSPDGTLFRRVGQRTEAVRSGLAEQDLEETLPSPIANRDWSRDARFVLFQSDTMTDEDVGVIDLKTRMLSFMEANVQAFEAGETPRLTGEHLQISRGIQSGAVDCIWIRRFRGRQPIPGSDRAEPPLQILSCCRAGSLSRTTACWHARLGKIKCVTTSRR
jgi:hypothetical protein